MTQISNRSCLIVILAAGEGKRMASDLPKVLHPIAGLSMLGHVMRTASEVGADATAVVVGNQAERVAAEVARIDPNATTHVQTERRGTAHAVLAARTAIERGYDDVVVLSGDVPLLEPRSIDTARAALADNDLCVLGFDTPTPFGYGRMVVKDGQLVAIREEKDASVAEKAITFCNSGIMAFRGAGFLDLLSAIDNNNAAGEFYLTSAVEVARAKGQSVVAKQVPEEQTLGVNDRVQLAGLEAIWQRRRRTELLRSGVTMQVPESVVLHHDTQIAKDVTIEPNVVFSAGVSVASGATIRSFSHLEGAQVGHDAVVGPYARLRPGTNLAAKSKIGNFVETKNTAVGEGAKINHLSYVGDASVGAAANIGAGTITCNYDGFNKHRTEIGAGAFIGTNTALVAPVKIGKGATTAAGSVISKSVPDDALAIERSDQRNLDGKAKMLRDRYRAKKEAQSKG